MPIKGQFLLNPTTHDSYKFLETAQDTDGEYVLLHTTLTTTGLLVPNHLHVSQDETFEVLTGALTVWANGRVRVLGPGERLVLPRNQPHNHFNAGESPVAYLHHVSPALDFDYLIENMVGLSLDGKGRNGKFGLLQELVWLKHLDSKSFLADMPRSVQQALMAVLTPLGRLLGYRAVYKKYSGIEK